VNFIASQLAETTELPLRLLEALLQKSRDAIAITGDDPLAEPGPPLLAANPAFAWLCDCSPAELVACSFVLPGTLGCDPAQLDRLRAALRRGEATQVGFTPRRLDGDFLPHTVHFEPVDVGGASCYWLVRLHGGSTGSPRQGRRRQRALEALLTRSEARLHFAVSGAGIDTFEWNIPSGTVICQGVHYPRPYRSTYRHFLGGIHPEDRAQVEALIAQSIETGEPLEMRFRVLLANGRVRWFDSKARVSYDRQGHPLRMAGISIDVTERLEAERSQRRLLELLEATTDIVGITDFEGRTLYLNRAARRTWGFAPDDDVFHFRIDDAHPPHILPRVQEGIAVAVREGFWSGETAVVDCNSREIPTSQVIIAHRAPGGELEFLSTIIRNISERVQAEEHRVAIERNRQLEVQMAELQKFNRLKDEFLSTVSHELRTPIASIGVAIHLLEQTNDERKRRQYLSLLRQECERERKLIDDLLDLQRLEERSSAGPRPLVPLDLGVWLPRLIQPFVVRAAERQQTLTFALADDLPPLLTVKDDLERILTELLHNACKYTPTGGAIALEAHRATASTWLALSVRNSGAPIPPGEQERIFDKFYRVSTDDTWQQGGTGLGLALVKQLVTGLDGTVRVESDARATVFTVLLPLGDLRPGDGRTERGS
jgi:PAS domain S-box-containing protein